MKSIAIAIATAALVSAAAASASAQGYVSGPAASSALPPWDAMQNDGSSSDYPTHMPGDFSADRLNHAYRHGLTVPSGAPSGFVPPPE